MNKTLIIYYSYTGNTRVIVNKIQKFLECDVLELKPKIPFEICDYDNIVNKYQSNESDKSTVEIENIDINLDDYKNIVIGTPVWWYSITPVVREFLINNDLTNKTIYAFATNAGWIGRTFKEIESLVNGNIQGKLNIKFTEDYKEHKFLNSESELEEFINQIKNNK